jgi:2-polyprenyl-3-methyl-5-hydroxy-6-metoxy-1,4-benzoquinol methylase
LTVRSSIDTPLEDELVYQHGFQVRGWVRAADARRWRAVVVRAGEHIIGATALPLPRADVATALDVPADDVGFVVRCTIAEVLRSAESLEFGCELVDADGNWLPFATRTVRLSPIDYRIHMHGSAVTDQEPRVMTRSEVYTSGAPSPLADPVCTKLVMQYLQSGDSVLDVGCGVGAYRHALAPHGIEWTGCEARSDLVDQMRSDGLNVTLSGGKLPFDDVSFDATICIEVLEHIEHFEEFLQEISRVSKRVALFSVPNFGAVPIASSVYALPFHMLEPDHKNFFTARSLAAVLQRYYRHVETFEYGPLDLFRSHDGIAVNNHIFAVAVH